MSIESVLQVRTAADLQQEQESIPDSNTALVSLQCP